MILATFWAKEQEFIGVDTVLHKDGSEEQSWRTITRTFSGKPRLQEDNRLDTRNEMREVDLDLRIGMSHATKY